ncbi:MAG: universal stress protein [Halioglobus sp.]|nr:universal stress protein [Halioglobus sp.]
MALDTILVVIDPTTDIQPAFERGFDSARDTGATLHLYTCCDAGDDERVQPMIDDLSRRARGEGVTVSSEIEHHADWASQAVSAAARLGASMIFKNSTDHSAVDREKRRTSDWTLLRTSPCPVLMVKNFHDWGSRKVLAAINPESTEAAHQRLDNQIVSFTRQLASTYGSEAHFVTAFNDLNHPPNADEIAQQCGAEAQHIHLKKGPAPEVIRDVAGELDVDLIIVGTVGRDGIKGRVVGNTCEKLLDQTHSDVLVLN